MGQRVALLVDVQNVFYSARSTFNGKLDYNRLRDRLVGDRCLIRAIAYVVQRPDVNQDSFYEALTRSGFENKVREAKNRTDNKGALTPVKGSVEVMLTVDAMALAKKVDTIILVSGDGNYAPLVQALSFGGCRVEIVGFEGSTSGDLVRTADQFIPIPKEWTFEMKEKQSPQPPANKSMYVDDVDEVDLESEQPIVKGQPAASRHLV